jgi:hypothetical protein
MGGSGAGGADRAERHLEDERKMLDDLHTALADL